MTQCPECEGKGQYVGLNVVETCESCSGTDQLPAEYFRRIIRIKGEDSPNVRLGLAQKAAGKVPTNEVVVPGVLTYAEFVQRRLTMDREMQCVSLDADWYEGAENLLFPPSWLNYAETVADELERMPDRKAVSMGVDSGEGTAETVWTIVDYYGIMNLVAVVTPDTSIIPHFTIKLIQEYGLEPERVMFDAGGGGREHAHVLWRLGYKVTIVAFGVPITAEPKYGMRLVPERKDLLHEKYAYKNRRAQMYGQASIILDPQFEEERDAEGRPMIPPRLSEVPKRRITFGIPRRYTELRRQLAPIPKWYDEGKLYLPPKERKPDASKDKDQVTMQKLIGCSPDQADALVLAVHGLHQRPAVVAGEAF